MSDKETLYARWLSGDLSAEELEALKASGEATDLEAIIKATEGTNLPPYDVEGAYKKFKQNHPARVAKRRRLPLSRIAAIAATVALLVAAALFLYNPRSQALAELGRTDSVFLADGSTIVLNDGSSIAYRKRGWSKERKVELSGEASFDVAKGAPFIVETANGQIEVLGTQFNVRAWGDKLYVECFEGKVRVSSKGESVELIASESVNILKGKMEAVKEIKHDKALWSTGISRFHDEDLNEAFAELERQYNIKVTAPDFEGRGFSGFFRHDNIEEAVNNICTSMKLDCQLSADKKSLTIR